MIYTKRFEKKVGKLIRYIYHYKGKQPFIPKDVVLDEIRLLWKPTKNQLR